MDGRMVLHLHPQREVVILLQAFQPVTEAAVTITIVNNNIPLTLIIILN
jgi:hypothetical protein